MDNSIAAKHEPVFAVVIRFSKARLYWLFVRQFFRFPDNSVALIDGCLSSVSEYRAGQGFYYSAGILSFLMVGVLPGIQIFRMRDSPGVNSDTQHIFADSGISTVMGPLSNFAEWSFAADATEDKQHLTVKFRSGAVVLPKDQVRETGIAPHPCDHPIQLKGEGEAILRLMSVFVGTRMLLREVVGLTELESVTSCVSRLASKPISYLFTITYIRLYAPWSPIGVQIRQKDSDPLFIRGLRMLPI